MAEVIVLAEGTAERTAREKDRSGAAAARKAGFLPHMRRDARDTQGVPDTAASGLSGFAVGAAEPRAKLAGTHREAFGARFI